MITPLFKRAELGDVEHFQKFVDEAFEHIPKDGKPFDIQPINQRLFFDSATEFIFGESIHAMRDPNGEAAEIQAAFGAALSHLFQAFIGGWVFAVKNIFNNAHEKHCKRIHKYVDDCIARHKARSSALQAATDEKKDAELSREQMRQRYVLINGMSQAIKDPLTLRFQLLQVFIPAREVTGNLVSNSLFLMARNPEHWQVLRKEALALQGTPLTFEVLKSQKKFLYTLWEAIRLLGPAVQTQRQALKDVVLPRGGGPDCSAPLFIPKGDIVSLDFYSIFHNPEIWGDDVEEFRPSRFENRVMTWEFTPFLGGPRICPANQQVLSQAIYLLVRLVTAFERIENADPCYEYIENGAVNTGSRNGVKISLHPAKA